MRCKCADEEWASCSGCLAVQRPSRSVYTGKKGCEGTCGWGGTWVEVPYHLPASQFSNCSHLQNCSAVPKPVGRLHGSCRL